MPSDHAVDAPDLKERAASTGAMSLKQSAVIELHAQRECCSHTYTAHRQDPSESPARGHDSASFVADVLWESRAVLDCSSTHASKQQHTSSAVDVRGQEQSTSWWPSAAEENVQSHDFTGSTSKAEQHSIIQAGEAVGDYILYRF